MRMAFMIGMILVLVAGLHAVGSFVDNGDGTVKDAVTGLVWQKCTAGQNALNCVSYDPLLELKLPDALKYCKDLTLAGKKWRLPTVIELRTLVDYKYSGPTINDTYFRNTRKYFYWTSSQYENYSGYYYVINFMDGTISYRQSDYEFYIRCVVKKQ